MDKNKPEQKNNSSRRSRNNRKILVGALVVVLLVVIVIAASMYLKEQDMAKVPTIDEVKNYCLKHDLAVEELRHDTEGRTEIRCNKEYSMLVDQLPDDYMRILFSVYDEPREDYKQQMNDLISSSERKVNESGEVLSESKILDDSKDYSKAYSYSYQMYAYAIMTKKTSIEITSFHDESLKEALIEMGYPDENWL